MRLSDPFHDNTEENLAALLCRPDSQLSWSDFQVLLGPHLPAGAFEESVYFLPLAFDYVRTGEEAVTDVVTSIVWFVSTFADEMGQDGVLAACRAGQAEMLSSWTSTFQLVHYDRMACKAKGWGLEYQDLVQYSDNICCLTCDLVRFDRHQDIAVDFYQRLAQSTEHDVSAAWLLELWRAQADIDHPPKQEEITAAINNLEQLKAAVTTLLDSDLMSEEQSPTYWRAMLASFDAVM